MSREKRLATGLSLLGIGGTVLGFGAAEQQLSALRLPHTIYAIALYGGALLFLVGVILAASSWEPPGLPEVTYKFRPIRRIELRSQLRLVRDLLGEAPPLRAIKDIYNANPNSIWLAERITTYRSGTRSLKVIGFFSLVPLNENAVVLLEEERLDGLRFNSEHICSPKQRPAGLYIGSIAVHGWRARGEILGYVRSRIDEAAESGIHLVYTRPITHDGLRLAKRHDFVPVADDCGDDELKRIYKREYQRESTEAPNPGAAPDS
jgi:hypothetical protein